MKLFDDQRLNPDYLIPYENYIGPLMTKEEVLHALKTIRNGISTEPDEYVVKYLNV